MPDQLEEQYREPWSAWKTDPSPPNTASLLRAVDPVLRQGTHTYAADTGSLMAGRARRIALDAFRSYEPSRGRLGAHLTTQLRGLQRVSRQQQEIVRAPEKVVFDSAKVRQFTQELQDKLGREPTDREMADHSGMSLKRLQYVRQYRPGVSEGSLERIDPTLTPGVTGFSAHQAWLDLVYDELPPTDQKIMELSLGLHGRKPTSNQEIAKKLKRSPGAISQRKQRIQELLDREPDLSPFLG